jgi:hypothetical protein
MNINSNNDDMVIDEDDDGDSNQKSKLIIQPVEQSPSDHNKSLNHTDVNVEIRATSVVMEDDHEVKASI